MKRIRAFWRWSWRPLVLFLAAAAIATWIAGHETRNSDDYLGYSSRWGTLVSEWFNGFVILWAVPPMREDMYDSSTDPSTHAADSATQRAAQEDAGVHQRIVFLGPQDPGVPGDRPAGLYHFHGENSGESQMFIMIIYGDLWRKILPGPILLGACGTAEGDHWHYLLLPTWLLGTMLLLPAATWGTSATIVAARSRRNHHRNRCPTCGYDLRASPNRCPECGAPTPPTSNRTQNSQAPF